MRYPGRNPFHDAAVGPNSFEYFFKPLCDRQPKKKKARTTPLPVRPPPHEYHHLRAQQTPALACDERERVHREVPWAVRTYYYGAGDPAPAPGHNVSDDYVEPWCANRSALLTNAA